MLLDQLTGKTAQRPDPGAIPFARETSWPEQRIEEGEYAF